jgi:hypothetical protein
VPQPVLLLVPPLQLLLALLQGIKLANLLMTHLLNINVLTAAIVGASNALTIFVVDENQQF